MPFSTNLTGRLKEPPITCRTIEKEDHVLLLVAESVTETTPNSMHRIGHNDSREDTRSRFGNDTRNTRNTYMPSRNRQDTRDDSRQRYGQRYDSRERRPEQQNRSIRFEPPCNDRGQNRQNMNFNKRNGQN